LEAGWSTLVCPDAARLGEEITKGAGCAVVVEDVVGSEDVSALEATIRAQPTWSDFPVIVLTSRGDGTERNVIANRLQDVFGNVSFLERPFHPTTLVSVTRSALRSRRRQYIAREVLERRDLLARELQHRTKNLIAVIQAIASASLQQSPGREAFFERLHALAKAQDLIIEGAGRGALMSNVVKKAMENFGARASLDGPEVFLNPGAAQGFALILHELATNAAKHGSLSTEMGTVSVRWSVDVSSTDPTINFQWQERGGPAVTPPKRRGFGSVLLERAVPTVVPPRFDYSTEGFSYEVQAVLAEQRGSE
jgi:two-component sensor histidine kinase